MSLFKSTGSQAEDSMGAAFATVVIIVVGAIAVVGTILFFCARAIIHHIH